MKRTLSALLVLLVCCGVLSAVPQEKAKTSETSKESEKSKGEGNARSEEKTSSPIPLRVQILFTEYDNDKKVVSLPYSFSVNADERRARPNTQIRDGVKIPVPVSTVSTQGTTYQYMDVGTNIDCSAQSQEDGRFKLVLTVERSSLSQEQSALNAPVVRQFRAEMNPILRDGQTFESVMATDPVNGHVYRVSVTLNVPK